MEHSPSDPIDSRQLKAIAHPVRIGLLSALRQKGPGTSSTLASALSVSSGLASYHLRILAEAQLIEEVSDRGTARERWWCAAHEETTIDTRQIGEGDREALDVVEQIWDRRRAAIERRWTIQHADRPAEWRAVRDRSDWLFRLTPDEARDAVSAVSAALDPFRLLSIERRDGIEPRSDDASLIAAFLSVVPVDEATLLLDDGADSE